MKGRAVALDELPDGRRAAALMVDGKLADVFVDAPDAWGPAQPGAIYLAKLGRPMKGQGGAIVDLGDGKTGFLRESKGLAPGIPLLVQVSGVVEPGKAPPVTRRVLFKSRYAIVTPGSKGINVSRRVRDDDVADAAREAGHAAMDGAAEDLGLILRSSVASADPQAIHDDAAEMRQLAEAILAESGPAPQLLMDAPDAHLLAWRDWAEPAPDHLDDSPGAFERLSVWEALSEALTPRVALQGGADMYVEPTRALVAVDVNTRGDTSPAAGLKANVAAFRALPGALRLRGLAGQVTVDPAPFPKKERSQLEQVMRGAIRQDGGEITLAGWSPLGHLELQRKRDRHPLKELLKDALPDL